MSYSYSASPYGRRSYETPNSHPTNPEYVPMAAYQQVISDLESAHVRLAQLSAEQAQLHHRHEQLHHALETVVTHLQSVLQMPEPPRQSSAYASPNSGHQHPLNGDPARSSMPPAEPEFLTNLKRRQASYQQTPPPADPWAARSPQAAAPHPEVPPSFRPSQPPANPSSRPEARPEYGSAYANTPDGRAQRPGSGYRTQPSAPSSRQSMENRLEAFDDLFGLDPTGSERDQHRDPSRDYGRDPKSGSAAIPSSEASHLRMDEEDSVYRRARDQHTQSQPMVWWILLAVVLVGGSFGAGFMVVQPFVSPKPASTPAPLPPTQTP